MSNVRIHPFLHIDRSARIYLYEGRKDVFRSGDALPSDPKKYALLPSDILPTSTSVISSRFKVRDRGKPVLIREAAVYDREFLHRFFSPAYTVQERLDLLQKQYGYYTTAQTAEAFLEYLDILVANAPQLLGGKEETHALWQSVEGRLLLDWIQHRKGDLQNPASIRKGKSRAQVLDTKTQLAVVYYLHKGGILTYSLKPTNELVYLLAGLLSRTASSLERLTGFLTEEPSIASNPVLTKKYIRKAKLFFEEAEMPDLASLAQTDLIRMGGLASED